MRLSALRSPSLLGADLSFVLRKARAQTRRENDLLFHLSLHAGRGCTLSTDKEERMVRRNVAASSWKYPRRMTFSQWRRVPYREKHGLIAQAQCDLLGYWRDCAKVRCRRDRRCLFPDPCYWDRKQAMSTADWAAADALCKPLRALMRIGSTRGSEGLWLF